MAEKQSAERNRQRYCVKADEHSVTTTVHLDKKVVETTVYNDGSVVTKVTKPP